jgi:hypothetical protein
MSAFDSAMLMIEDLSKQVVELEQKVWNLELANWHVSTMMNVRDYCKLDNCQFCSTHIIASVHVHDLVHNED